jgi:hypothetical protein
MMSTKQSVLTARPSPDKKRWRLLLGGGAALSLASLTLHLVPASPARAAESALDVSQRDCDLMLQARQKLLQDFQLKRFNLGVDVRKGVVILWGSVPTAYYAQRAENDLRTLPGLGTIRNELRIESDGFREVEGAGPPHQRDRAIPRPVRVLRGTIAIPLRLEEPRGRPDGAAESRPVSPPGKIPGALTGAGNPVPSAHLSLGTVPRWSPPQSQVPPSAAIPKEGTTPVPLGKKIEELRNANPRYLGIVVTVRAGLVYLAAPLNQSEELFLLAQAVAGLPGVERVIVNNLNGVKN